MIAAVAGFLDARPFTGGGKGTAVASARSSARSASSRSVPGRRVERAGVGAEVTGLLAVQPQQRRAAKRRARGLQRPPGLAEDVEGVLVTRMRKIAVPDRFRCPQPRRRRKRETGLASRRLARRAPEPIPRRRRVPAGRFPVQECPVRVGVDPPDTFSHSSSRVPLNRAGSDGRRTTTLMQNGAEHRPRPPTAHRRLPRPPGHTRWLFLTIAASRVA